MLPPPRRFLALIALATIGLAFSGCANLATTRTGFLGNYDQLAPSASDKHRLDYTRPHWPQNDYPRVLLEPTIVRLGAKDTAKITPAESAELAAFCDAALKKAFATDRTVAAVADQGTLRIRGAVTGVDTSSPTLNVVTGLLLWPLDNGGVSLEFEVLDGASSDQLLALVAYSEGTPLQVISSFSRFGHAHSGIERWIAQLRKGVDAASKPPPPKPTEPPAATAPTGGV
ncbi:MAG: DUF3313 domain-containing protein [Opitutaceae bacterium]